MYCCNINSNHYGTLTRHILHLERDEHGADGKGRKSVANRTIIWATSESSELRCMRAVFSDMSPH